MLRNTLLYLSNQPRVFKFVRNNRLAKHFARRFVAGETLDEALEVVRALNARASPPRSTCSARASTTSARPERRATSTSSMLDRIHETQLDANVSVKLTAMGLDIDHELCVAVMQDILDRAPSSTTRSCASTWRRAPTPTSRSRCSRSGSIPTYKANVGVVLQSYLYRTFADVEHMNSLRARVRICKGAYKEPPAVAYPEKKDVDANYVKCMRELMLTGNYPGIATHDPAMINEAKRWAKEQGIAKDRFEFQMLYGVRRDLQESLVRGRLPDARLRALRHAVVSVSHAPPRRAPRERRVHHGQRHPRSAAAPHADARALACPASISPPITVAATPTPSAATRPCTGVPPRSRGGRPLVQRRDRDVADGRPRASVGRVSPLRAVGAHRRHVAERPSRDGLPRRGGHGGRCARDRRRALARRGARRAARR